ncbi:hypothetical protein F5Y14DRAFT_461835 [Nemania sp. NC0429]|nr:hypothetical protein F5Y14DRAFT_461835 [Nemania sp. NC0429]
MNGNKDATGSDPAPASKTVSDPASPTHVDGKPSTAPSTPVSLMTGANGNGNSNSNSDSNGTNSAASTAVTSGATNKKRKKDALKPIITIEGPAPVARRCTQSTLRQQSLPAPSFSLLLSAAGADQEGMSAQLENPKSRRTRVQILFRSEGTTCPRWPDTGVPLLRRRRASGLLW